MTITTRNQAKWDNLQDAGATTIDAILAGKASDKDIKALSTLLTDQHALAGEIFDQGVEDAKQTADSIVDRLNKERIKEGKRALTQKAFDRIFKATFQNVMSQAIEDILGQVHDEFETQSKEIRDRMEDALEKIRNIPPPRATNGTEPEPRSRMDRLVQEPESKTNDGGENARLQQTLMDKVLNRAQLDDGSSNSVLTAIKETLTATRDKITSLYDHFTRNNDEDDEEKRATIWMRKLKSIFNPVKNAYGKVKSGASKLGNLMKTIGEPLLLAVMNPQLIKFITDAVSEYLSFDKISGYVSSMWDETKKIGSDSIDWIIDKVKSFFGFGKNKPKTPANEVKKTDPLTQHTQTGELPKSITAKDAADKLPSATQALDAAKKTLVAAESRYATTPTPANKKAVDDAKRNVTFWQTRVTQYTQRAGAPSTAGRDVGQAASITPPNAQAPTSASSDEVPKTTMPSSSVSTPSGEVPQAAGPGSGGAYVPQTTSAMQSVDPSSPTGSRMVTPPKTEVVGDTPQFSAGKAYDSPEKQAEEAAAKPKQGAAIAQIGLGSFGFDSNDSSLNILNLGMIS